MDERDFYNERPETKTATYSCPKCREKQDFKIRWLRRTRKAQLPRGAMDEYTRAKFANAKDHMVRVDDTLYCANASCRAKFDIPNFQTVVFIE